jgi:threonine aldolase
LYALDHNIDRLADDHENARRLARALAQIPGLEVEVPETNLVFFDTKGTGLSAEELAARVQRDGILISTMGQYRARACLHLDVHSDHIAEAEAAIRRAVAA